MDITVYCSHLSQRTANFSHSAMDNQPESTHQPTDLPISVDVTPPNPAFEAGLSAPHSLPVGRSFDAHSAPLPNESHSDSAFNSPVPSEGDGGRRRKSITGSGSNTPTASRAPMSERQQMALLKQITTPGTAASGMRLSQKM